MKEKVGEIFSIAKDNPPVPGCTISREIQSGTNSITYFSLAPGTDISAEIHPYRKLLIAAEGSLEVYGQGGSGAGRAAGTAQASAEAGAKAGGPGELMSGDSILIPADEAAGIRTAQGAVYTEIAIRRSDIMNKAVKAGEVFKLADLVPYQDGRVVNMDVVHSDSMKFVVMAFDGGTGLSEHAAPGEAIIFALDGEGIIGYEGREYPIRAGENFHFAKGGMHSVRATGKFKMALLLTLE